MSSNTRERLGILISQYPAGNHAVILREIRCLREHLPVFTASVRAPDRPVDQLTPEEREEAAQTYYVKPHGARGAFLAHLDALLERPKQYVAGLKFAMRLAGPGRALLYFGYFTEALMLGRWMRRHSLRRLHVHYSSTVGLLVKRVFPIALSVSFHGPDEFADPETFHLREKVNACSSVRAISNYARGMLMNHSDAADWGKIRVVYMGIDPAPTPPLPSDQPADRFQLICVGRLAPVKAQRVLIEAVDSLTKDGFRVRLHLVGGGPDRVNLETLVESRGLQEEVIVHGFMPEGELQRLYRSAHVFALPSLAEGVPGVLMEAMALQIPCVATEITGVPELIENGISGVLVPVNQPQALADAIARLLRDGELRQRIGRAARTRVCERFDIRKNAAQLANLL